MKPLAICLYLSAMIFLTACISEGAAVIQTAIMGADAYLSNTKETLIIQSAECGNIQPIYPSDNWDTRLTEDEKNQIVEQAVRLKKLCPLTE